MLTSLSKNVFYPLWELKDKSKRLQYLRGLNQTQWLSHSELMERQWTMLKSIVDYAYTHCPYYRELWGGGHLYNGLKTLEDFRRLPILSKQAVRGNTDRLISDMQSASELRKAKTGGSTGTALNLYFDRKCQQIRNAAAMRADQWAGWDLGVKRAAIWGSPPKNDSIKAYLRNLLLERYVFLDTMDMKKEAILEFVDTWRRNKPKIIYGHAHSIFILAKYLQEYNITDIRPKGIIATSMMLLEPERVVIENVFGCRVTDRYGCEEVGLIACECEKHEGMHINMDHIFLEILDDEGQPVPHGEHGNIVVTDLINKGMPLIRYKVEDVGVVSDRVCSCGRGQPLLEKVVGRVADFLIREDGSRVAGVSLVEKTLTAIAGLDQMQIVQNALSEFSIKIVKGVGYSESAPDHLRSEIKSVFGDKVSVNVELVEKIPVEKSGKYRFSICKVN